MRYLCSKEYFIFLKIKNVCMLKNPRSTMYGCTLFFYVATETIDAFQVTVTLPEHLPTI